MLGFCGYVLENWWSAPFNPLYLCNCFCPRQFIWIIYWVFIKKCIFSFLKNSQSCATFLRQHWTAIGWTENVQPIIVTVHSDLRSVELLSYTQGVGCSELGKNTILNEHPVTHVRNKLTALHDPEELETARSTGHHTRAQQLACTEKNS